MSLAFVFMYCLFSVGYFVDPTIVEVTDPKNKLMQEVGCGLCVWFCVKECVSMLCVGDLWTCTDLLCIS